MDFVYAVIDESNNVTNIVTSDNPDSAAPLRLLIPDATDIVLSTEHTGYPYVGGDYYNGIFRPPAPYPSWVWDDESLKWTAPTPYPQDENLYIWDEDSLSWVQVEPLQPES